MTENTTTTTTLNLFDIAVNLTDPMFRGIYRDKQTHKEDLLLVLKRAKLAGVRKIIAIGTNLEDSAETLKLASNPELCQELDIYTTVGVHPTNCRDFEKKKSPDEYEQKLKSLILSNPQKVIAIGECGLDYARISFCPKETQIKYFERQLDIASEIKLPLFLHNRATQGEFLEMIKMHRYKFTTGVVHSYDGSLEEALELINLDLYIGLNGCSMKTPENLEVIKQLPLDRILVETDSPWCDIRPSHASYSLLLKSLMSGVTLNNNYTLYKKEKFVEGEMVKSRNEPCNVLYVLCVLSELHNKPINEVSEIVYNNSLRLFFPEKSTQE